MSLRLLDWRYFSPLLLGFVAALGAAAEAVKFDLPASIAVRELAADEPASARSHEKLVAIHLQMSTFLNQPESAVEQIVVTVESPSPTFKVADFLPQTTLDSRYAGPLAVKNTTDRQIGLSVDSSGIYKGLSAAVLTGKLGESHQELTEFKLQPPLDVVAASGTIQRGRGVYFKLRPSSQQTLEGAKEFLVIARVPDAWRGDLLRARCAAEGKVNAQRDFLVALYLADDTDAQERAEQFSAAERELRQVAATQRKQIAHDASPKLLQKLGFVEPTLSPLWLHDWLYGEARPEVAQRLPSEVRSAALQYKEARKELHALSSGETRIVTRVRIED